MTLLARILACALACCALAPGARAASLLVMASTDPALPAGTMVEDGAPIAIAAGAEVTLLNQDGSMATLAGPYAGPIPTSGGEASPDLVAAIASLVGEAGQDASEFGSVRGGEEGADDPWVVDLSVAGAKCAGSTGPVRLWRGERGAGSLAAIGSGAGVALAWPEGGGSIPWPADVPLRDSGAYGFVPEGGGAVLFTLRLAPSGLPSAAHLARWLADAGCRAQALSLLDRAARGGGPGLALATPRGAAPAYRVGETLSLAVSLATDAWLECLYAAADGAVVRLFPNSFSGGPRLGGPFVHALPRPGDGLALTLSGPGGREEVRCFAWSADPGEAVPSALRTADITAPLALSVAEIEAALAASARPPEESAVLAITVEP